MQAPQTEEFEINVANAGLFFQVFRPAVSLEQAQRALVDECLKLPGLAQATFSKRNNRCDGHLFAAIASNILMCLHDAANALVSGYNLGNLERWMNDDTHPCQMIVNDGITRSLDIILALVNDVRGLMTIDVSTDDGKIMYEQYLTRLYYHITNLIRIHTLDAVKMMIAVIEQHQELYSEQFAEIIEKEKARLARVGKMRRV